MKAANDWVLIEEIPQTHIGSIELPEYEHPTLKGKVLSVGPGKVNKKGTRIPSALQPGDIVLFHRKARELVNLEGKDLLMVRESRIDCVVDE